MQGEKSFVACVVIRDLGKVKVLCSYYSVHINHAYSVMLNWKCFLIIFLIHCRNCLSKEIN